MKVKKSKVKLKPKNKKRKTAKKLHRFNDLKPRILIVDDNLVNREVAGEILKKSGCEVDLASNGLEAVYKAKTKVYDIIFMDIQMPEMDGIEANSQIKRLNLTPQPVIVAMTAYSMKEDEQRFLEAGLDDYIAKPIRANQIIGKVEQIIFGDPDLPVAAEEEQNELQTVNEEVLAQLEKFGGREMIINAFKDFEEEASGQLEECKQAIKESKYDLIQKHLHTLKGSAGTLGIEKLAEIARKTEAPMKAQDYSDLSQGLQELNDSFVEFRKNFANIISNY
jgi:CheY-like chemotaxis protein/HPt (histidine-containing phosphotransfer) domain-containing protein